MAHRVEKTQHDIENTGVGRSKSACRSTMVVQGAGRTRATLGQIGNNVTAFERPGKSLKGHATVLDKITEDEALPSRADHGRPRTVSVESMDTDLHSKEQQRRKDITDIDANDHDSHLSCAEYANEIYAYLRKREPLFQVPLDYIKKQKQVNERMRAILIDWLVQVHDKFRLLQETLFLTVSFIDRYLSAQIDNQVEKGNLQLVGVTAMFMASKIEEMYTPEIGDFVYITDNAYTARMIRDLERTMARLLDYNFGDPLCIHFLRRNSKAVKADVEKHTLAKYFMELTLPDYESLAFPPSMRAAAALCLAMKITDDSPWNATVEHYSNYTEASLTPCMKKIAVLVLKAANRQSKLVSVTTKYNRSKFYKIASSPCLSNTFLEELAKE